MNSAYRQYIDGMKMALQDAKDSEEAARRHTGERAEWELYKARKARERAAWYYERASWFDDRREDAA
jgi:hypothetical protein